ncbi:uncharacterized protein Z518_05768 [Rhinocladiella mackenziei CBS 650.93]|uniref:Carboxylic ester hydrolase n=1 Tax=Rhinocladiella mackenziei CBS 650.93 TaxID=1442369 RepID=A0A0D2FRV5_9EURO|nr:uncharacterized protein Z518_05768 [Rhinocladiella mackenziei CBS 650.93]KIX04897.1 hypothetical protein Z518_05768 [Rhinocladiella mackenziei CBS 650.93]
MARMAPLAVILLAFVIFPFAALSNPGGYYGNRPTAHIDSGLVVGFTQTIPGSRIKLNTFLGIPFAAKPVRWGPPIPPAPWKTPFDASNFGPACVQQFNYPDPRRSLILKWFNTPPPPAGESEDCLNLNVYAPPPTKRGQPKAVMVWLYGGGLLYGSNSGRLYNASGLAANEDVIVVVLNYRTNVFGFPGSPQLPPTERNLGFLDQRLALDWVQRNIAAFGGDPDKVTIFGESAGALSVDALLTQPPEPVPFYAAIMESGTATFRGRPTDPAASWNILVAAMNCTASNSSSYILSCMRGLPATTIKDYNEHNRLSWSPVFDNVTSADTARSNRLTSTPSNSKIARVPILGGSNADEGRLYSVSANDSSSFIRGLFPTATDADIANLLAAYPIGVPPPVGFPNEFEQLAAIYTDFVFQCPARLVAIETAQVGIPSWRYYYNASFPNTDIFPDSGVYHSSEIGIVLDTYPDEGATPFQVHLSHYVQKVWADFAKNPYGWGVPPWPQVSEAMGMLGGGVRVEDGPDAFGPLLTVLDPAEMDMVDQRCWIYQPIYDFLGH